MPEKYLPDQMTISNANQLLAEEETWHRWWGWTVYALKKAASNTTGQVLLKLHGKGM